MKTLLEFRHFFPPQNSIFILLFLREAFFPDFRKRVSSQKNENALITYCQYAGGVNMSARAHTDYIQPERNDGLRQQKMLDDLAKNMK